MTDKRREAVQADGPTGHLRYRRSGNVSASEACLVMQSEDRAHTQKNRR